MNTISQTLASSQPYSNTFSSVSFQGSTHGPWEQVFLWKPMKIKGRWNWLKKVYRRKLHIIIYPPQGYQYGDAFDILKE